ncbi:MAG: hypothetical protein JO032_06210 [Alphaproteobacteria bacterium]|nr:hypothetical protein [Alphaproteobacteria bacterium]MBV9552370.1 hypothetical protein [Alphaproteobacteria bacterium]
MKHLLTATAIAAAFAVAAPAFAQSSSEYLNSVELYRIAVEKAAKASPTPVPYPFFPWAPYYPSTAAPNTYPLAYYPFAPLATVPGTGGSWKWENGAYHWYPAS